MDAEAYRADSREHWEAAAKGWSERREPIQRSALPVSEALIEHAALQPGHAVLEVAAGLGDTGLLAAELVQPGGTVVLSDVADAMVEAAQGARRGERRAQRRGPADGGRVARRPDRLAGRDPQPLGLHAAGRPRDRAARGAARAAARRPDRARRLGADRREPVDRGPPARAARARPRAAAGAGRAGHVRARRARAGSRSCWRPPGSRTSASSRCGFAWLAPSLDAWWDHQRAVSISLGRALDTLSPADHYALRDAVDSGYAPYVADDGSVALPACSLVAWAEA